MPTVKKPPASLGKAGRALWRSVQADLDDGWGFDSRELNSLAQACRVADDLARLDEIVDRDGPTISGSRGQITAHPCLIEARQLRGVQQRLLAGIELADPYLERWWPNVRLLAIGLDLTNCIGAGSTRFVDA